VDTIILTIDDVPYETGEFEKILDVLNKYKCKATFFVISSLVNESNRHLLISAIKNGHHLANHGVHNTMHALYYYDSLYNENEPCQQLINNLYKEAGVEKPKVKYFRAGVGIVTNAINRYCKDNDYKIVLGTNYCSDPRISNVWLNEYYIKTHLKPNDIIILHDRKWTPELLERLFSSGMVTTSMMSYDTTRVI
jgi:peptidoglycan/xylan/chitin deacetylase (PgdA/CDA1 family)